MRDGPRRIPSIDHDQSQLNSLSFNVLHQISDLSTIYVRYLVPNRRVSLSSKQNFNFNHGQEACRRCRDRRGVHARHERARSRLFESWGSSRLDRDVDRCVSVKNLSSTSDSDIHHSLAHSLARSLARSLVHAQAFRVRRGCLSSCRTPRFAPGSPVPTAWSSRSSGTTAGSALMWPGCRARR